MTSHHPTPIGGTHAGHRRPQLTLPAGWVRHAACGPDTAELFFPVADRGPAAAQIAAAQAICARCPVRAECRDDADTTGQQWGIWGGITEQDRIRRWRRARKRPTRPVPARRKPHRRAMPHANDQLDTDVQALAEHGITVAGIAHQLHIDIDEVQRSRARTYSRRSYNKRRNHTEAA